MKSATIRLVKVGEIMLFLEIIYFFKELLVGPTAFSAYKTNRVLKTYSHWGPHFEISMEVLINSWDRTGGIIHFTTDNTNPKIAYPGTRYPWIRLISEKMLYLRTTINEKALFGQNDDMDISNDVSLKQWFNMTITQYPMDEVEKKLICLYINLIVTTLYTL